MVSTKSPFINMAFTEEKVAACLVAEQYCNIINNKRELLPYYLSNQVILKWFGKTITGKKDVCEFVCTEMAHTFHILTSVEPGTSQLFNSGERQNSTTTPCKLMPFSETDYLKTQERNIALMKNLAFSDDSNKTNHLSVEGKPPQDMMMMGDTALNMCCLPVSTKVEKGQGDCVSRMFMQNSRIFKAQGALQFCRTKQSPTSTKNLKLASDTMKWERVCKVHVEYNVSSRPNSANEFEICLIIYEDTIRCRRNLALEFAKIAEESF